MKRWEYRQRNKSKLNEYHKKYYHSKKNKEEKNKEDNEDIKSIVLGNNNHNDNSNDGSDNDSNDESNNEKEEYINVSYIIEEMKSLKDELETTRTLLENTNLLVEILNDELIKKHRHIKNLKNLILKEGCHKIAENQEDNNDEENNEENQEENNGDFNHDHINYNNNNNDHINKLTENDIMDVDYEANKNNYFSNHIYKGLKLKNKEDEIKVLKMLN